MDWNNQCNVKIGSICPLESIGSDFDFFFKHLPNVVFLPPSPYHSLLSAFPHLYSNKYNYQSLEVVEEIW